MKFEHTVPSEVSMNAGKNLRRTAPVYLIWEIDYSVTTAGLYINSVTLKGHEDDLCDTLDSDAIWDHFGGAVHAHHAAADFRQRVEKVSVFG